MKIVAAIIESEGKILIAQRAKNDHLLGKWEFPGGKVEEGETLQECLQRELQEELGIHAEVGEYFCSATVRQPNDMSVFKIISYTGQITLNDHSAIAWVTPQELSNYEMPEPDAPIVELLQRELQNCFARKNR